MIVVQTPLRISFVGGGTDFKDYWSKNGGEVISSAIDKYVYVVLKHRFDDAIYLNYSKKEIVSRVDDIKHDLIREAMRKTRTTKGIELTTLADIPSEGSGLGSSSSITVALLHALYAHRGELVTAERLAREACEIEIDILCSPIGMQDQYIAAYGGLRHFCFKPNGNVGSEDLLLNEKEMRQFGSNLQLFFLDKTRKANTILKQQKANIETIRETLDSMRGMVKPFKAALLRKDFDSAGRLLHQTWIKKKCLSPGISNPEIDRFYEAAIEAGAIGGKVAGAGGGGFLLTYCQRFNQNRLFEKMLDLGLRELPFHLERHGSRVIFSQNRYEWR